MNGIFITPAYAALFALFFVALSIRTIVMRRRYGVALGHGDQALVERATRAHANFAEYVPFTLLLVAFLESLLSTSVVTHALCIGLLVGRIVHAYGVSQPNENYRFRVTGMLLTFTVLLAAALLILWQYVSALSS
ncbi:MAG: MAPEG family protein [Pseudomonadota bacterium]